MRSLTVLVLFGSFFFFFTFFFLFSVFSDFFPFVTDMFCKCIPLAMSVLF